MGKSKDNDAFETIILHKAEKMRNSKKYKNHINNVLNDHNIDVTKGTEEIFIMGGVDAMIYDVASELGFTRNTNLMDDWASLKKRREILKKIFPKRTGKRHTS